MKKVQFYIRLLWRPILAITAAIGTAIFVLTYKMSTLMPGYTKPEIAYFEYVKQGTLLPDNPIYYPIYLLHKIVLIYVNTGIDALRYTNAFFGLFVLLIFFYIARNWFTNRIALITSSLMLASSWFLLATRTAEPFIFSTLLLMVVALTIWLQKTNKRKISILVSGLLIGVCLYIPGAIWFIAGAAIWKRKYIFSQARTVPFWYFLLVILGILLMLVPMLLRLDNINFVLELTGLPRNLFSIRAFLLNCSNFIASLFWNANRNSQYPLGSQGLFDIYMATMLIAGIITAIRKRARAKSILLLSWLFIGILLIGLGGATNNIILMPPLMLLVGYGITWLLQQWFAVFPKNPVAHAIGIVLVGMATVLSITYNTYRYFVAWPSMDQAKSSYIEPR